MTPYGLAQAECANLLRDGSCLGVRAEELGNTRGLRPSDHCVLKDRKRCRYFEAVVLPLADALMRQTYLAQFNIFEEGNERPGRYCPDCGGRLPKRKRYCPECAKRRQRESERKARRVRKS